MNDLMKYMRENDCPIIFDLDGTLTCYAYSPWHAYHDLDTGADDMDATALRNKHIYRGLVRPLPIMQAFIKEHNIKNIYLLSKETHGQEDDKKWFANNYYNILPENCFFAKSHSEKVDILLYMMKFYSNKLTPVYIDDNAELLCEVRNHTPYYTGHITLFMKEVIF